MSQPLILTPGAIGADPAMMLTLGTHSIICLKVVIAMGVIIFGACPYLGLSLLARRRREEELIVQYEELLY
jgi:hypothetical protein